MPFPERYEVCSYIFSDDGINKLKDLTTCKICSKEMVDNMLLPCGHLMTCTGCFKTSEKCNVCNKKIESTVKAKYLTKAEYLNPR